MNFYSLWRIHTYYFMTIKDTYCELSIFYKGVLYKIIEKSRVHVKLVYVEEEFREMNNSVIIS